MSRLTPLEGIALAVLAIAYLITDHYPPWSSFYNESAAALALALLCAALGRRWLAARISPLAPGLLLVAAIPIAQWMLGQLHYSGDAWISALYVAGFAIAIAAGQVWAQPDARPAAAHLSAALLATGLASSFIALLQLLDAGTLGGYAVAIFPGAHASANVGQPNNLGTLLGLAVLGLWLLFEQRRLGASATAALLALLLVGLAATQSRTALLFGPVMLVGWWWSRRAGLAWRTPARAIVAGIVAHAVLTLSTPVLQAHLLLEQPTSIATRSLSTGRGAAWTLFLDALSRSPWDGYGWLQVGAAQLAVAESHPPISEKIWFHAHNLFLDLLLWCGGPLGVVLSVVAVAWFVDRVRRARSLETVVAMLAVALFGVHAMLELPHHYAYLLVPVGLWIGIAEHGIGPRLRLAASWMLAPAALAAALVLEIWREYPAVEEDFRLVRFELLRIGTLHATAPAPPAPLLSSLTGFLAFARTVPHPGQRASELAEAEASVRRYAYAPSMFRYAQMLAVNGRLDDAVRAFVLIRRVHGERSYQRYREALREEIERGRTGLDVLEARLPPVDPKLVPFPRMAGGRAAFPQGRMPPASALKSP